MSQNFPTKGFKDTGRRGKEDEDDVCRVKSFVVGTGKGFTERVSQSGMSLSDHERCEELGLQ